MLAKVSSAAVVGIEASPIDVEVDVGPGLPGCLIVGLPDAGVREGGTRIKAALDNAGFAVPRKKVTVNLAPADLRKDGAAFDVPIAVGWLAGEGLIDRDALAGSAFVGELALDGSIRPVRGVLPIAAWARVAGLRRLYVPRANGQEARLGAGACEVVPVGRMGEVVLHLRGGAIEAPSATADDPGHPRVSSPPDLADIRGQPVARRALEIAAAGAHNLIFVGPPGSGKTMLARRMPGILPGLTFDEALEATMVHSVAGVLGCRALVENRPFRAPHHTVTVAGLVGGGPQVRPGEISLAHRGVLFLDELLEFRRHALEALRQPLEEGEVSLVRARRTITYPADFMLLAALNPCPCGHLGSPVRVCTCSALAVRSYRSRLSGPLADRIDLHVEVPPVAYREMAATAPGEGSAAVRARVEAARGVQRLRGLQPNGRLAPRALGEVAALDAEGHRLLERAVDRLGLSARAIDKIRRIARTIADLDEGGGAVRAPHVAEAVQYRLLDRPAE